MMSREHLAALGLAGLAGVILLVARRRRLRPPPILPSLLEHINLNIPSESIARDFYLGLGGAVNPKTTNWRQLHINIGASQWHLLHSLSRPDATPPGKPVITPQLWPGLLELWTTEPLPRLREERHESARALGPSPPPPRPRKAFRREGQAPPRLRRE